MTKLQWLQLGGKFITDAGLAHLAPLHELTGLQLDGHAKGLHGTGLAALSGLAKLKHLNLADSGIVDEALPSIGKFANLERLNLSRTLITGKGLQALAPLSHLKSLQLHGCRRLEGSMLGGLAALPELAELSLDDDAIQDDAIASLEKLTKLRLLTLLMTPNPGHGMARLEKALPKCQVARTPAVRGWWDSQ